MNRPSFTFRASEQHHPLEFSPEGVAAQIQLIQRLADMGMNRAYMAQCWPDGMVRLVDYATTLPALASAERSQMVAHNRAGFEEICAEAVQLGIEPWPSLNILNYPDNFTELFPDAIAVPPRAADRWMRKDNGRGLSKHPQLCASSVSFARLVEAQVGEICQLPHVAGVELWLAAGDTDIFYCDCADCKTKNAAELIAQLTRQVLPVCQKYGRRLLVRCYLGGWRCALETDVWRDAAALLPTQVEIAFKQQPGDFMNWHGANPLAGQLGSHPQHVEFDAAGEYRGINYGIVCTTRKQMTELVRHYSDCGVTGIIFRKPYHLHAFDLDKWLFAELSKNPDVDEPTWSLEWATGRFGEAGSGVLAVLDSNAEVIREVMYVNGVQWASWAVPHNLARLRFILFDRCAPCVPGSWERLQPTTENIRVVNEGKKRAILAADALVAECEGLKGKLAPEFFEPLHASCQYLRLYARFALPLMNAFFHFLKWEKTSSEVTREYVRAELVEILESADTVLLQAHSELKFISLEQLATLIDGPVSASHFEIPLNYAATILNDIRERIEVAPSSWWSVYPWPERWPKTLQDRDELYRD